ncbi:hypothetical protein ACRRTK_018731 [Alexandromys fortis]
MQQNLLVPAQRSSTETSELRAALLKIFPDSEQKLKIDQILVAHPYMKDLNALSALAICASGEVEPLDGTWCLAVVSDKTKSDSEEQGYNSVHSDPSFLLSAGQRREYAVPAYSLIGPAP